MFTECSKAIRGNQGPKGASLGCKLCELLSVMCGFGQPPQRILPRLAALRALGLGLALLSPRPRPLNTHQKQQQVPVQRHRAILSAQQATIAAGQG